MGSPSAREVQQALGAELLQELQHQARTSTEWLERLAGQLVNHTLKVWSGVFPADGVIAEQFGVAAGSIYVRNLAAGPAPAGLITVSSAGPAPAGVTATGVGTFLIPAGASDTVPLASHQVTLYGTAAAQVCYAVFTAPVRPGTGAA